MTKRRVERELEEGEELLEELSPEDRLQLYLRAEADGNDHWMDRLIETCPQHHYRISDPAFIERREYAVKLALKAVYELSTTLLEFQHLDQVQRMQWVIDDLRDESPPEEVLENARDRADQLKVLFGELYSSYHGYRQFSDSVLGVELDTWLGGHPDGLHVLEKVESLLEDRNWETLAEEALNGPEADPEDEEWMTLDDGVAFTRDLYINAWTEATAEL